MNMVTSGALCLALLGCLAGCAETRPAASADHVAEDSPANVSALAHGAASRLGPPSPRGVGFRRIDRAASVGFTDRY